jgi:hypothetical protein
MALGFVGKQFYLLLNLQLLPSKYFAEHEVSTEITVLFFLRHDTIFVEDTDFDCAPNYTELLFKNIILRFSVSGFTVADDRSRVLRIQNLIKTHWLLYLTTV